MNDIINRYDEVLNAEIDGWCYGITNYPGEIFPGLVHRVVRELAPSFQAAIEHNVVFDILDISLRFSRAAKYLVDEREICFVILAHLPNPTELTEDGQFILAQIIDQAEQAYGSAVERLEKKWAVEKAMDSGEIDLEKIQAEQEAARYEQNEEEEAEWEEEINLHEASDFEVSEQDWEDDSEFDSVEEDTLLQEDNPETDSE